MKLIHNVLLSTVFSTSALTSAHAITHKSLSEDYSRTVNFYPIKAYTRTLNAYDTYIDRMRNQLGKESVDDCHSRSLVQYKQEVGKYASDTPEKVPIFQQHNMQCLRRKEMKSLEDGFPEI